MTTLSSKFFTKAKANPGLLNLHIKLNPHILLGTAFLSMSCRNSILLRAARTQALITEGKRRGWHSTGCSISNHSWVTAQANHSISLFIPALELLQGKCIYSQQTQVINCLIYKFQFKNMHMYYPSSQSSAGLSEEMHAGNLGTISYTCSLQPWQCQHALNNRDSLWEQNRGLSFPTHTHFGITRDAQAEQMLSKGITKESEGLLLLL